MPRISKDRKRDRAVVLLNLGSPASPTAKDVRPYLREFLMDKRVLDTPYLLRKFIVEATILPKRPIESAEAYEQIWWDEGSPLVVLSGRVRSALEERIGIPVGLGMRYGEPTTESALRDVIARAGESLKEIIAIPLYPHYAMSSYETAAVAAHDAMKKIGSQVQLKISPPFYKDPLYVEAMVQATRPHLEGGFDHVLFSFHGIPERHVKKTDSTGSHCLASGDCCDTPSAGRDNCYRAHAYATTAAITDGLGLGSDKFSISFQSRLGRDPWLKPYTDFELVRLAKEGVKKLVVLSPAFVSDCLETLEELGIRGRADFLGAGGKEFSLVPCLNEHPAWIDALEDFALRDIETFTAAGRI